MLRISNITRNTIQHNGITKRKKKIKILAHVTATSEKKIFKKVIRKKISHDSLSQKKTKKHHIMQ